MKRSEDDSSLISQASKEWRAYMEPLLELGEKIAPLMGDIGDPQLRREMYHFLYSQIAQGYMGTSCASPQYPDFWPFLNIIFNTVDPNPDMMYYLTPIEGKGTYRISGYRGTIKIVDIQIGGGSLLTRGEGEWGQTFVNYNPDDLHIGEDGYFEVLLSNECPAEYEGDWWMLNPSATNILVRQIASDWINEVDARLAIERVDLPAIKPRPSVEEIDSNLRQVPVWAENWAKASIKWLRGFKDIPTNTVALKKYSDLGGVTWQVYIYGAFELDDDEALIYETEIPKSYRYWMIQLNDDLFRSIDWMNRQSSLTDHSAKLDKDGKFRAVISARDPGVPNWLDTAGYQRGAMFGRWHTSSDQPTPTVTKVKLVDVRKLLPADTPVVTPQARDAALRLRRKAAQLRRRW